MIHTYLDDLESFFRQILIYSTVKALDIPFGRKAWLAKVIECGKLIVVVREKKSFFWDLMKQEDFKNPSVAKTEMISRFYQRNPTVYFRLYLRVSM